MKVQDLKAGDILIRISDGSEWEFEKSVMGKITVNATDTSSQGRSGIVEYLVMVRPFKPRDNRPQDLEYRGMQAAEFKVAEVK